MMTENKRIATPFDDLTYKIIGCAMAVHRRLGSSHRENVYQRDLQVHFTQAGLSFEPQKLYEVYDSLGGGSLIGYYIPDFVEDEKVVVEIKAIKGLDNSHLAQVIGYLAVSGLSVGLLINFGTHSLEYKRILPPKKTQEHMVVNRQWLFVPDWLKPEEDSHQSR
jgi:GxxExxY protein